MKTSRRGFFATLMAMPVIAKYLPEAWRAKYRPLRLKDIRAYHYWQSSCALKIGETIRIRKPVSFIVADGLGYEPRPIPVEWVDLTIVGDYRPTLQFDALNQYAAKVTEGVRRQMNA